MITLAVISTCSNQNFFRYLQTDARLGGARCINGRIRDLNSA
jgi:hypothetical protein